MASTSKALFKKTCHIKWHKETDKVESLYDFEQRRFVSSAVCSYVLKNDLLHLSHKSSRLNNICNVCVKRVEQFLPNPSKKCKVTTDVDIDVNALSLADPISPEIVEGNFNHKIITLC